MDALAATPAKPSSVRRWLARNLAATLAVVIVIAVLVYKNEYHFLFGSGDSWGETRCGLYGWPRTCVERADQVDLNPATGDATRSVWLSASVSSWPSLGIDILVTAALLAATWLVFSRTQRRIERWRQLSLPTLVALLALAGVLCAILKSESFWGW